MSYVDNDRSVAPPDGRAHYTLVDVLRSTPTILMVLALILTTVFALQSPSFGSRQNIFFVQRTLAVDLIVAVAQLAVLAVGGINIAVGATGVMSAMVAGFVMQTAGLPVSIAIAAALAAGAGVGACAGLIVVGTKTNSFIVTLTLSSVVFGATVLLTKATGFTQLPVKFIDFGRERLLAGYVSPLFLIALLVSALTALILRVTVLGRQILLTGANPRAAHASGISTDRVIVFCQVASGLLAAVAGIVVTLRNGAAIASMAGNMGYEWLLPSFIIPILGGTSMFGGKASVIGCFAAAVLMGVMRSGLLMSGVNDFDVEMIFGAMLLAAVVVSRYAIAAQSEQL